MKTPKVKPLSGRRPKNRQGTYHKAQELAAEINGAEALKLHVGGMSLRKIGERLGVSHITVKNYIDKELADLTATNGKDRERLREIQRQRVEVAIEEAMHILTDRELEIETVIPSRRGDKVITVERFKAVVDCSDVVIKGTARLAALYGLDAPKEIKAEHSGEMKIVSQEQLDETTQARLAILRRAQSELAEVAVNRG